MLGAFAAFALILAIVGVYGVMSHLVTQGAHDIGVRMALGAERRSILLMVLRQGMELTVAGSVLGVIGAVALTRVMASLLFGVSTTDLATFTAVPLILIATAMLASYIPALRATRVDPSWRCATNRRIVGVASARPHPHRGRRPRHARWAGGVPDRIRLRGDGRAATARKRWIGCSRA